MNRSHASNAPFSAPALLGALVLVVLPTTGLAQTSAPTGPTQDLRNIAAQYKQIAADYLPGTSYERAMSDLISKLDAMSADESSEATQYLKPLLPGMRTSLQIVKDSLSKVNKPPKRVFSLAGSAGFPNAEYPDLEVGEYPAFFLSIPGGVVNFVSSAAAWLLNGFQLPDWGPASLSGLPLTCHTSLDTDGNPVRMSDEALAGLRLGVQVAEITKETANVVLEQEIVAVALGGGGGNLKWLTIFPTGIYLVTKNIYENYKECDGMISGAEATASYRRLGHVHDDMVTLNSTINTAQGDLTAIKDTLNTILANQAEIIKLLKTPEGKRPGWNKEGY